MTRAPLTRESPAREPQTRAPFTREPQTREDKLRDYLTRVTVDLAEARRQLAERSEPIAIVGLSCRFAGAAGPEQYWDLLSHGRSGVRDDAGAGRFDLGRHAVYTRRGAVLDDIAGWDHEFFGAPPREALRMDPHQRLLMELTWEAFENAGTPPPSVAGSRTAVMIGYSDPTQYGRLQEAADGSLSLDPYTGQGISASVVAGRLAYHFDLRGPTITLDTACSSSLVAVHLACESLRRGESELAVAGGAFLLIHPDMFVTGCTTSMFSRAGLCRTFDAAADGYAIGEGGGVVILQRLRDAMAQGRRIHAVIRGSATNQDGRSNGLTAPNRGAQVEVIRAAHAAAGVAPADIAYLEAHGSATALGDAIEIGALQDVFAPRAEPLPVGAVKTNVGHTQAAAGIAGLIKTVLVLSHGEIPPNLNLSDPAEAVRAATAVRPVTESRPLASATDGASLAGVSSFGWAGSNAHVVLEAAPARTIERSEGPYVLPVSAHSASALRDQVARLADWLADHDVALADVAYTLQAGRATLAHQTAVIASDRAEAVAKLRALAEPTGPTGPIELTESTEPIGADFAGASPTAGAIVDLPSYAFQRQRFWAAADVMTPTASAPMSTIVSTIGSATGLANAPAQNTPTAQSPPTLAAAAGQSAAVAVGPAVPVQTADEHVQLLARRWAAATPATETVGETATETATLASERSAAAAGRVVLVAAADQPVAVELAIRLRVAGLDVAHTASLEPLSEPATVVDLAALGSLDARVGVIAAAATVAAAGVSPAGTRLWLVTAGGHAVADPADPTQADPAQADPVQAAVAVLPIVANQEYLALDAHGLDLDPAYSTQVAAAVLEAELRRPTLGVQVAHRAGIALVPSYAPVPSAPATPVRPGGTYLITGGLGDIGLTLAGHLAAAGAGRIILTSRTGLPAAGPRTDAVTALRGRGVQIDTPSVDVTDRAAMHALLTDGPLDGIVHAAAETSPETFRALRDLSADAVARHFGAKVDGARMLGEIVDILPAAHRPRWCLLFSSTSALLGGVTFGGYAAANAALSALATRPGWIAAEWDTWACTLDKLVGGIGASLTAHAMSDAQALDAFDRLVSLGAGSAVVAAGGLTDRLPQRSTAPVRTAARQRYPRPDLPQPYAAPLTAAQRELADVWGEVLGLQQVGLRDNFFDLGGTSLLIPHLVGLIQTRFGVTIPTVVLFEAPTVQALAAALSSPAAEPVVDSRPVDAPHVDAPAVDHRAAVPASGEDSRAQTVIDDRPARTAIEDRRVAIVGLAGRFPGAEDVDTFWRNVCSGVDSISFFTPEELIEAGVDPDLAHDPAYVPARPILTGVGDFDAGFFGLSARMAALTDPQQRLFLEVAWEALEQSGYSRRDHGARIGVFGGSNISTYLLERANQFRHDPDVSESEMIMSNDKDALATTVSYLFDLHGPSVTVQSFCSTSLVGVHLAVQSLRAGDCELALAGGVSIRVPDKIGHLAEPGGQESHDGKVHTFDADATGTMFGDGATAVVLKRLADAVRDGDEVYGVIRGSAMNNDGALKVGYTAPSVAGQSRVIVDALADAGVRPEQIGYVEAHGTATELGDPIEVAALTRAFGPGPGRQSCPIGSVKTNVGHLNHAAGTAGLIKTALSLRDGVIPATLNYRSPNPQIDFGASPFYVNTELTAWPAQRPRLAGLNSLGLGGTNVHVILEAPPARPALIEADPATSRRHHVLPISARTADAAQATGARLAEHLRARPELNLADVAHTLQLGRRTFEHRRVTVASSVGEAAGIFAGTDARTAPSQRLETAEGRPVAFVFAGVGEQYPGLVGELYRREPAFRVALQECLDHLIPALPGVDIADLLLGARSGGPDLAALMGRASSGPDERAVALKRTEVVQPLMFAVDYALARTLMGWGVTPSIMLGYSLGEYVAACLAGVLSLADAVALVVHRAHLIDRIEPGAMVAVPLSAAELQTRFHLDQRGLDVAAVNGPATVVVAGPVDVIATLSAELRTAKIPTRALDTTHAFHSRMLAPVASELTQWVAANVTLSPPRLAYLSNVTGGLADAELVCDPGYWARHMAQTVQFASAAACVIADPELAVLEIGPGQSLGALIRANDCPTERWPLITSTLPAAGDPRPADAVLTDALARLWLVGADVDWAAYHCASGVRPGRVPLPTYPFQRHHYWIDATPSRPALPGTVAPRSLADIAELPRLAEDRWLSLPVWRQTAPPEAAPAPGSWLVFGSDPDLIAGLRAAGGNVTVVRPGSSGGRIEGGWQVRPGSSDDALAVLRGMRADGVELDRVVHLWTLDCAESEVISLGLHSLVALARAAGEFGAERFDLDIVTAGAHDVLGGEARGGNATLTGPALVIPLEYPGVNARLIDVDGLGDATPIVAELLRPRDEPTVVLRGRRRLVPGFDAVTATPSTDILRNGGVYLITGGLGGIALGMAEQLATACQAKLVLLARTGLPPRALWTDILAGTHPGEDGVRSRIARVREIIEAGAEVDIVVGDVADPADVRRAVERAHERFGALHGVLHTAGVPGTGLMHLTSPADSEAVLSAKVAGARALSDALALGRPEEIPLDFLVLFSSITSVTGGGPGQVDYCAANAYLDGFAASMSRPGRRVLALNWGEWTWNAWDNGLVGFDDELQTFFRKHRANFGITFEEGWRCLLRALSTEESRLVVCTQDLDTFVRFSRHFTVDAVNAPADSAGGARHPRPELVTPYLAPEGGVQERIAGVWCDALKLERVGVVDNFFELGGSSLLGISLLATLRRAFPEAELPPHILYEAPTVSALAQAVVRDRTVPELPAATDGRMQAQLRRSGQKAAAARRRRPAA